MPASTTKSRSEGTPLKLTLSASDAVVGPGSAVTFSGVLEQLDGGAVPAAPLELQRITPNGAATIATATTDANGAWSATIPVNRSASVRALYLGSPAAASSSALVVARRPRRRR